jgi:hypothetical protein
VALQMNLDWQQGEQTFFKNHRWLLKIAQHVAQHIFCQIEYVLNIPKGWAIFYCPQLKFFDGK